MLPSGGSDLRLYLQGIFIGISTTFTTNTYFSPSVFLFIYFFDAAVVVLVITLQNSAADEAATPALAA